MQQQDDPQNYKASCVKKIVTVFKLDPESAAKKKASVSAANSKNIETVAPKEEV